MAKPSPPSPLPAPTVKETSHHVYKGNWGQSSLSTFLDIFGNWSLAPSSPRSLRTLGQRTSWERPAISSPVHLISLDIQSAATSPLLLPEQLPTPRTHCPKDLLCSRCAMNRASMLHPEAGMVMAGRSKQVKEAQDMTRAVSVRAKKLGKAVPDYELLELIGKGAFGRVFTGRRKADRAVVAVKIIDIDSSDYKLRMDEKDQAIKDFVNEISILQKLRDAKAKNINIIHDAFSFHSQLWIISEYCPGGSVHTLMRASNPPGLEENFIIVISRELAVALKYVHDAGIIHRDVKSANILITQDGQLQLCDFGVSGVLESNMAKRSTIIGTPYWMAPELHEMQGDEPDLGYGTEVDCWAFGCTVYELATGQPPNAKIMPKHLHRFLQKAPRLEDGEYSENLKEFVSFCLVERPEDRPTAEGILNHRYVANTAKKYPTAIIRQLIERYATWERSGGQRASLWLNMGASAPTQLDPFNDDEVDEWNFSTTADFSDDALSRFTSKPEQLRPRVQFSPDPGKLDSGSMTPFEQAKMDLRAQRGAAKMARLFDANADPYEYTNEDVEDESDLPFRRSIYSNNRETMIDLDEARASQDLSSLDLGDADAPTIRGKPSNFAHFFDDPDDEDDVGGGVTNQDKEQTKRQTMEWTFPAAESQQTMPSRLEKFKPEPLEWSMQSAMEEAQHLGQPSTNDPDSEHLAPPARPMLKHTVTEPIGNFRDYVHLNAEDIDAAPTLSEEGPDRDSMIDLDAGFATLTRQSSIAQSSAALSASSEASDVDPFSLQPDEYNDRTVRGIPVQADRTSLHGHSLSEPAPGDRSSGGYIASGHTRGSSLIVNPEHDRQLKHEQDIQFHQRNISVQASIDSLRRASAADDYWENDHMPAVKADMERLQAEEPLLKMPHEQIADGNWRQYEQWDPPRSRSIDDFHSSIASDTDDYQYRHTSYSHSRNRPSISTNGYSIGPSQIRSPGRGGRRYESDADSDVNSSTMIGNAYPRSHPRSFHGHRSRHRRILSFPDAQPPDPAALDVDADPVLVAAELERLLNGYMQGLEVARMLLKEEQGPRGTGQGGTGINGGTSGVGRMIYPGQYARGHVRDVGSGSGSGSSRDMGLMMGPR